MKTSGRAFRLRPARSAFNSTGSGSGAADPLLQRLVVEDEGERGGGREDEAEQHETLQNLALVDHQAVDDGEDDQPDDERDEAQGGDAQPVLDPLLPPAQARDALRLRP